MAQHARRIARRRPVASISLIPVERIEGSILLIRGQKVLLDRDLAALYGVSVGALNQAVRRNADRFPDDFAFQLTWEEAAALRSQTVILRESPGKNPRPGAHARYRPYAFTEQGVAMLSSVLRSPRAVRVNIEIMRAFVKLRKLLASRADLARRINQLEAKYDETFKIVFDAIRLLMAEPGEDEPKKTPIGFRAPALPSVEPKPRARRREPALTR